MNQLGDLLFSLPVLKATKQKYPDIKIYSVVRKNLAELLKSANVVDKVFIKTSDLFGQMELIANIRKENIPVAVMFSESPETMLLGYYSKIPKRIGFKTASLQFLLTDKVEKTGVPSLNNNVVLAKEIGLDNVQKDYLNIINVDGENNIKVSFWLEDNNLSDKEFMAVAIGASKRRQDKCLDDKVWKEVLNRLAEQGKNVIVVGAVWERERIKNLLKLCDNRIKMFCPDGGLTELAAMIKRAKLFLGIDSGTMHLAASLGVKCVALFGNTDPNQIGPRPLKDHIIIKKNSVKDITAEEILDNVR